MTFSTDLAKLAFEQGTRALAAQVATVDNARTRFGVLLGGGNIATAFLGKDAIGRGLPAGGEPTRAFVVGIIAFLVFVAACMYGLLPRGGWSFDFDAQTILDRGLAKPDGEGMTSIDEVHRDLAVWSDTFFAENGDKLKWLYRSMFVAVAALVIEFAAFLIVLGQ